MSLEASFDSIAGALSSVGFVRRRSLGELVPRVRKEKSFESSTKLHVEDRVDQRIHGAIDVAQPENEGRQRLLNVHGHIDERIENVVDKERQPAEKKDADDDAQRSREASFARERDLLPFVHQRGETLALEEYLAIGVFGQAWQRVRFRLVAMLVGLNRSVLSLILLVTRGDGLEFRVTTRILTKQWDR